MNHDAPLRLNPDDQLIELGGLPCALPADHLLPHYLQQHRLYDRFLPVLATVLPPASTVIDVGANCGDTLAAMLGARPDLHHLCIEPDAQFHRYLQHNRTLALQHRPQARVDVVQALVGKQVQAAVLDGGGGSRHARLLDDLPTPVPDPSSTTGDGPTVHRALTLDAIVEAHQRQHPDMMLSLLKCDVDGFDHDVLASADQVLDHARPLLYFECQANDAGQLQAYKDCIDRLIRFGYDRFWLFDNYGNPMLQTGEASGVHQVFDYIWRQGRHEATRTMYYVDILASQPRDHARVDLALQRYLASARRP